MTVVSLVFLSFVPCFIWFLYCLAGRHATVMHIFFFTLAAVIAVILSVSVRFLVEPVALYVPVSLVPIFTALVATAVPEELSKMMLVLPFAHTGPDRTPVPERTLCARAVCVALAFASLENLLFASRYPAALLLRSVTAVPFHGATALFSALWLSRMIRRRVDPDPGTNPNRPRFLLSGAIMMHAVYAWAFVLSPAIPALSLLVAVIAVARAVYLWKQCGGVAHGAFDKQ